MIMPSWKQQSVSEYREKGGRPKYSHVDDDAKRECEARRKVEDYQESKRLSRMIGLPFDD